MKVSFFGPIVHNTIALQGALSLTTVRVIYLQISALAIRMSRREFSYAESNRNKRIDSAKYSN